MGSPTMMHLTDGLAGVTKLGLDTAPLIYFVERHPDYLDLMREVLRLVDTQSFAAYGSAVTLTEVLTQPLRAGNAALADEYRQLLLNSRNFTDRKSTRLNSSHVASS